MSLDEHSDNVCCVPCFLPVLSLFFLAPKRKLKGRDSNWTILSRQFYFLHTKHCLWQSRLLELSFENGIFIPYYPSRHFPRRIHTHLHLDFQPLSSMFQKRISSSSTTGNISGLFFLFLYVSVLK